MINLNTLTFIFLVIIFPWSYNKMKSQSNRTSNVNVYIIHLSINKQILPFFYSLNEPAITLFIHPTSVSYFYYYRFITESDQLSQKMKKSSYVGHLLWAVYPIMLLNRTNIFTPTHDRDRMTILHLNQLPLIIHFWFFLWMIWIRDCQLMQSCHDNWLICLFFISNHFF